MDKPIKLARNSMSVSMHKKRSLPCDALCYSEDFKAAASVLALQVLHFAAKCALPGAASTGVPYDSIFSAWFKLKKEALTINSTALQGVVLWSAVQTEVVQQPGLVPSSELQIQLLVREFSAAAAVVPGIDFSAEQLQCAQLLHSFALTQLRSAPACSTAVQLVVRALLMCAQVAFFKPEICIPKDFSPNALKVETLPLCCSAKSQNVIESSCCSSSLQERCPSYYLLSFALSICDTVGTVPPFDAASLLYTTQAPNSESSSKSVSRKPPKSTPAGQSTAERCGKLDSKCRGVQKTASVPPEWLEICADVHFWLMVSLLQLQKLSKKHDDTAAAPSLTAAAADLEDEQQQPDYACDVQSNTAALLHSPLLLHSAAHAHQALHGWSLMLDSDVAPEAPSMLCRAIAAVGHFCALHGRTAPAALSWKLLLQFSDASALHSYKLKACCELIWTCPEHVESSVTEAVQAELSSIWRHDTNTCVMAQVALAYHRLCMGQESEGWPVLLGVLRHEVVTTEKTVRAMEVQCLAYYVASLYSLLPQDLLGDDPALNPEAVALIAAEDAIALTHTACDVSDIHWAWRVSWLHQLTSAWLGRLALHTAQPWLAQDCLKASLAAAQEDVLPYRAAVAISLLAEMDLLCDQLDDCRVKVETLLTLLSSRPPCSVRALDFSPTSGGVALTPANLNKTRQSDATPLTSSKKSKALLKLSARNGQENSYVNAISESKPTVRIEAMHQALSSSDKNASDNEESEEKFSTSDAQNKLGTQWIAKKSRPKFLSHPSTKVDCYKLDVEKTPCPESPSVGHRETALHLPAWRSPYENSDHSEKGSTVAQESCVLDAYFPLLCEVYLTTGAMLTSYHRQSARWQAAQDTVDAVSTAHNQMQRDLRRHCRIVASILGTVEVAERDTVCATNALVGWCSAQRSALQMLMARRRWSEVVQLCNSIVAASDALPIQSVWRHRCHVQPLLQQACLLLDAHPHLAATNRDDTDTLVALLASPVLCPTVGAVTPHCSRTLSRRPPPLRRAPQFDSRSHRDNNASCDSDVNAPSDRSAELVQGSNLNVKPKYSDAKSNGKQRRAFARSSDSNDDNARVDSGDKCSQKSSVRTCKNSSASSGGNARARSTIKRKPSRRQYN